jgi:hypothetical protein
VITELAPRIYADVSVIPTVLRTLRETPPPAGGVLSAYLPAPPAQVAGWKYLVRFREECKAIRQELETAARDERAAFEAAFAHLEEYLAAMPVPRHPGLAQAHRKHGHLLLKGYACPLRAIVPDHSAACQPVPALVQALLGSEQVSECCIRGAEPRRVFAVAESSAR